MLCVPQILGDRASCDRNLSLAPRVGYHSSDEDGSRHTCSAELRVFQLLGLFAYRFRWAILLVWAALVIASVFFAPDLSGRLKGGGFDGSNSEAERVQDLMSEEFGVSPATLVVVFEGDGLSARGEEFQRAQEKALEGVRRMSEVRDVRTYAG